MFFGKISVLITLMAGMVQGAGTLPAGSAPAKTLIVGTMHSPPFAIKGVDGSWNGISIDLWRATANELGLKYQIREFDLQGLLKGVKKGSIDVVAAAITVTSEREAEMDFTHPFYTTGLGLGVIPAKKKNLLGAIEWFFSQEFLKILACLVVLILVVGFLVWFFEREKNAAQFGGGMAKGVGAGFWWAAVTMTTVGYGDKTPRTFQGRLVAILWMFSAMVIVATFTGMVASSLTIHQLTTAVHGLNDLPHLRVGTVSGSTSETFLRGRHLKYRGFKTSLEGLKAVASRNLDAFVFDAPMLRYQANVELEGQVAVLTGTFDRQDYAMVLPKNSPWRKPFNQILLRIIDEPQWKDTLYHYLGEQEADDGL